MADSPFEELMNRLSSPENILTQEQKDNLKNITGNVSNVVKASLINLLLGQFNKVATYESAAQSVISQLSQRAATMETDELISFLSVISKANAAETKTVMDMFKRNDNDVTKILKEMQKVIKNKPEETETITIEPDNSVLSLEKKERVLRLIEIQQSQNNE